MLVLDVIVFFFLSRQQYHLIFKKCLGLNIFNISFLFTSAFSSSLLFAWHFGQCVLHPSSGNTMFSHTLSVLQVIPVIEIRRSMRRVGWKKLQSWFNVFIALWSLRNSPCWKLDQTFMVRTWIQIEFEFKLWMQWICQN